MGLVIDNLDPTFCSRVKCRVLGLYDEVPDELLPWAKPAGDVTPEWFSVPDIETLLVIELQDGDVGMPVYTGKWINLVTRKPMVLTNYPFRWGFQDLHGNSLEIDKETGEWIIRSNLTQVKIQIWPETSNVTVDTPGSIIANAGQDIRATALKEVVVTSSTANVTVNAAQNVSITAAQNVIINAGVNINIAATGAVTITAGTSLLLAAGEIITLAAPIISGI